MRLAEDNDVVQALTPDRSDQPFGKAILPGRRWCNGLAQENRGTPEQRAACAPDACRLCSNYIPDPAGVEHCLRQNKPDLSDACRSVFEQSAGPVAGRTK